MEKNVTAKGWSKDSPGAALQEDYEALQRELIGTQEMLALVLKAVGEPVVVTKAIMTEGLPPGTQIQIDDDIIGNRFVFSLTEYDDE